MAAVGGPAASSNTTTGPTPQVMPSRHTSNNPFLGGVPATQQNMDNSGGVPVLLPVITFSTEVHVSTGVNQQAADDLRCLIPGCGKPVHVDAKGVKTSDYCSLRHRE